MGWNRLSLLKEIFMKKMYCILIVATIGYSSLAQQRTIGRIIGLDPAFDLLVDKNEKIEVLADTFLWAEGPAWVKDSSYLLFSDVKRNTIFKWKDGEGLSIFLKPSGYTGLNRYSDEPGSNGLIINNRGELVAC